MYTRTRLRAGRMNQNFYYQWREVILEAAEELFNETAIRRRASWTGPRVRSVRKTLTTLPPTARSDGMSVVPRSVFWIRGS